MYTTLYGLNIVETKQTYAWSLNRNIHSQILFKTFALASIFEKLTKCQHILTMVIFKSTGNYNHFHYKSSLHSNSWRYWLRVFFSLSQHPNPHPSYCVLQSIHLGMPSSGNNMNKYLCLLYINNPFTHVILLLDTQTLTIWNTNEKLAHYTTYDNNYHRSVGTSFVGQFEKISL